MAISQQAPTMPIDAGCCIIRRFEPDDKAELVQLANDWDIAKNLHDIFPHPYDEAAADDWLKFLAASEPLTNFAIEVEGRFAGGIGLKLGTDVHARTAEIGYWLGKKYWGRGIATAALRRMTQYAFANHNLLRVYAGVFSWNPTSMRVLKKAGYVREGVLRKNVVKRGHVLDRVIYAITDEMLAARD